MARGKRKRVIMNVLLERPMEDWNLYTLRERGVEVLYEEDAVKMFGSPLPEKFERQAAVDELLSLELSCSQIVKNEANSPKASDVVMDFVRQLYVCTCLDFAKTGTSADLCKCLLRLVGFANIHNLFIGGSERLEAPVGRGETHPDVVVKTLGGKILLVAHEQDEEDVRDVEKDLVKDLISAYAKNLRAGFDHGDIFGVSFRTSMPTFYRIRLTKGALQEMGKDEEVTGKVAVIMKYGVSRVDAELFLLYGSQALKSTLQCFEAMRRVIVGNVD